ncbi:MAG: NAD-binding protein, partial [Pseudomonadota bacterium]|nr:NAD-binding protein [Pseudomonadota bacterium]
MKILILGAGQVGASVAASLVSENDDITVVDSNSELLLKLQDHYDIRTIQGHASHPDVLAQAGAADADLILAVTNSDETNMIACQICHSLYKTPTKIARIRSTEY